MPDSGLDSNIYGTLVFATLKERGFLSKNQVLVSVSFLSGESLVTLVVTALKMDLPGPSPLVDASLLHIF